MTYWKSLLLIGIVYAQEKMDEMKLMSETQIKTPLEKQSELIRAFSGLVCRWRVECLGWRFETHELQAQIGIDHK